MFLDEAELHNLISYAEKYDIHRAYEIEWEFIKQQTYMIEEMRMPFAMISFGENVDWVGVPSFFYQKPILVNDNERAKL